MKQFLLGTLTGVLLVVLALNGIAVKSALDSAACIPQKVEIHSFDEFLAIQENVQKCMEKAQETNAKATQILYGPGRVFFKLMSRR